MGKFQQGTSGNPAGRPPRSDTERAQREAIRAALPGIVEQLTQLALAGDVQAARLLMDRALPALKPVDTPAPLALGADLAQASAAVLAAMAAGDVTPDQAGSIAGVLSALVRAKDATEVDARLTALEQAVLK